MKTTKKRILQMGLPIVLILSAAVILIFTFGVPLPGTGNYTSPAVIVDQDGEKYIVTVEKDTGTLFIIDSNGEITTEFDFPSHLDDFSAPAIGYIDSDSWLDIVVLGIKYPEFEQNKPGGVVCYVLETYDFVTEIDDDGPINTHYGIYPYPMDEPITPMLYDLDGDGELEITYAYTHLLDGENINNEADIGPDNICAVEINSVTFNGNPIGSPFILEKKIGEINENANLMSNLSVVNLPIGATVTLAPPMPQQENLVSWWKFEEGALCIDSGPNENDNDLTNEGGVESVPGKCGNAADFVPYNEYNEPNEQYLYIPNATDLHIPGDVTVACWVYQKSNVAANDIIVRYPEADPTSMDYFFYIEGGNGKLKLWSGSSYAESNDSVPVDSWHHIAFTRSGDNVAFYIDGAIDLDPDQEPLILPTGTTVEDAVVFVGKHGVSAYADMILDELCVWNVALDSTQIEDIYDMQEGCNGDDFVCDPSPASLNTGIVFTFNGTELYLITGVDTDEDLMTDEWGVVDGFPIESMTPMSGPAVRGLDNDIIFFTDYGPDNKLMICMYNLYEEGVQTLYTHVDGAVNLSQSVPEQTPPPILCPDTVVAICRWHSVNDESEKLMDIVVCTYEGDEIVMPPLPNWLVERDIALDQPVKGAYGELVIENIVFNIDGLKLTADYVEGTDYKTAAVADVNNDFKPDIVFTSNNGINIIDNAFGFSGEDYEKHWPTLGYNSQRTYKYDMDEDAHPPEVIAFSPFFPTINAYEGEIVEFLIGAILAYDEDPYDLLSVGLSSAPEQTPGGTPLKDYFNPGTQEFNWETTEGDEGTYLLSIKVTDTNGDSDVVKTVTVNVDPVAAQIGGELKPDLIVEDDPPPSYELLSLRNFSIPVIKATIKNKLGPYMTSEPFTVKCEFYRYFSFYWLGKVYKWDYYLGSCKKTIQAGTQLPKEVIFPIYGYYLKYFNKFKIEVDIYDNIAETEEGELNNVSEMFDK